MIAKEALPRPLFQAATIVDNISTLAIVARVRHRNSTVILWAEAIERHAIITLGASRLALLPLHSIHQHAFSLISLIAAAAFNLLLSPFPVFFSI
jgi:hypothetical protein